MKLYNPSYLGKCFYTDGGGPKLADQSCIIRPRQHKPKIAMENIRNAIGISPSIIENIQNVYLHILWQGKMSHLFAVGVTKSYIISALETLYPCTPIIEYSKLPIKVSFSTQIIFDIVPGNVALWKTAP
ncbi:hypothetical protein FOYG_16854 [Fusarium oxysporum NRRL 32931]|uniref:Uncharacterized protein n=2 Tax=Fusarium oxysporum TaxID=5507 RepID=W9HIQ3_FUSOX|nr:hypothetical protein FOYG_16854 [Fusarium oxysporum NRRL 32931]